MKTTMMMILMMMAFVAMVYVCILIRATSKAWSSCLVPNTRPRVGRARSYEPVSACHGRVELKRSAFRPLSPPAGAVMAEQPVPPWRLPQPLAPPPRSPGTPAPSPVEVRPHGAAAPVEVRPHGAAASSCAAASSSAAPSASSASASSASDAAAAEAAWYQAASGDSGSI